MQWMNMCHTFLIALQQGKSDEPWRLQQLAVTVLPDILKVWPVLWLDLR